MPTGPCAELNVFYTCCCYSHKNFVACYQVITAVLQIGRPPNDSRDASISSLSAETKSLLEEVLKGKCSFSRMQPTLNDDDKTLKSMCTSVQPSGHNSCCFCSGRHMYSCCSVPRTRRQNVQLLLWLEGDEWSKRPAASTKSRLLEIRCVAFS